MTVKSCKSKNMRARICQFGNTILMRPTHCNFLQASACFIKAIKLEKAKRKSQSSESGDLERRRRLPLPLESAVDGLHSLVGALVPRWHFRMLNDKGRNRKFAAAVVASVKEWRRMKGDAYAVRVLDIGAGTGLLSMVAARLG